MLTIKITLTLASPLHIGALSPASTSAVRGLVKDRDGWPYIPATTFKGRLRHAVERLGRGLGYPVCETHRKMCRDAPTACPACLIFGSPWIPGKVSFTDLELCAPQALVERKNAGEHPQTVQRFGVGLSRTRKVASDHLLYTTELFQPGVQLAFRGILQAVPDERSAAWIAAGVHYLDSLGADRSRGLGWLRGEVEVTDSTGASLSLESLRKYVEVRP